MANVTITGLNSPGSKRKAAPGLPEIARSLGALLGVQFRWNSNMSIYYAIYTTRSGGEHVFAADPKILHSEYLWIEWSKLVADFLAGKGEVQRTLDLDNQIKVLSAKVVTDDGFQEQTSTVSGPDDSSGSVNGRDDDSSTGGSPFLDGPHERPAPWQYTTAPSAVESGSDEPVTD